VASTGKKPVEQRRTEILDVTCDVVVERGFGAMRVQDVARRIGISTGLIHYHFDSKDALLAAAFQHAAQRDLQRLDAELGAIEDPMAKPVALIALYAPEVAEAGWMIWIDAWGEALRNPALRLYGANG
jgi:AcrR family transcriptional regulator